MKIALGQNQFFDDAGKVLSAGRISIYAAGTNTFVDLYTYENNAFVVSENPHLCDNDGRIESLYFEAQMVDVKVEKYEGGVYSQIDEFQAGFNIDSLAKGGAVNTIDELKEIDPSQQQIVEVNGYYTEGDCPQRKYLWVQGNATTPDGGYFVASNVNSSGRWLMIWEGEFLPASLYGVFPGVTRGAETYTKKIANLSNLFNFSGIGYFTNGIFIETPKTILFDRSGYYDIGGGTYTTNRKIASVIGASSVTDYGYVITDFPIIHCAGFEKYDGRWGSFKARFYPDDTTYGTEGTVPTSLFPDVATFMTGANQSWGTIVEIEAGCSFSFASYPHTLSKTVVDYTSGEIAANIVTISDSTYINPVTGTVKLGGNIRINGTTTLKSLVDIDGDVDLGGDASITGNVLSSGQVTLTGTELHSGTETHTGNETHSGTETHTGNETHSGTTTNSGTSYFTGAMRSSGTTVLDNLNWRYINQAYADSGLGPLGTTGTVGTRSSGVLKIMGALSFDGNSRALLARNSDVNMTGSWASGYENGELVIIVNTLGSIINVSGLGPSDSASITIPAYAFSMFMKYSGHWYSER